MLIQPGASATFWKLSRKDCSIWSFTLPRVRILWSEKNITFSEYTPSGAGVISREITPIALHMDLEPVKNNCVWKNTSLCFLNACTPTTLHANCEQNPTMALLQPCCGNKLVLDEKAGGMGDLCWTHQTRKLKLLLGIATVYLFSKLVVSSLIHERYLSTMVLVMADLHSFGLANWLSPCPFQGLSLKVFFTLLG